MFFNFLIIKKFFIFFKNSAIRLIRRLNILTHLFLLTLDLILHRVAVVIFFWKTLNYATTYWFIFNRKNHFKSVSYLK